MGKHRESKSSSGKGINPLVAVTVLAAVVWALWNFMSPSGDQESASTAPGRSGTPVPAGGADEEPSGQSSHSGTCGQAVVWVTPELLDAVKKVAERVSDDCVSYSVTPRGAGVSSEMLQSGGAPDVWIPGSRVWAEQAKKEGAPLEVGDNVAVSPVLIAGTTEDIQSMRDNGAEGKKVEDLLGEMTAPNKVEGASFHLGDPKTDAASMSVLNHASQSFLDGESSGGDAKASAVMVGQAQGARAGSPVLAVHEDGGVVVPATEKQIADSTTAGNPLQSLQPQGGMGAVEMPFVKVGDPRWTAAVDALSAELQGPMGQGDIRTVGLRPGDPSAPPPQIAGVPGNVVVAPDKADVETAGAVTQAWNRAAPPSDLLALIDISGSMSEPVGEDDSRIGVVQKALTDAIPTIPGRSSIGLWHFSTNLDGDKGHQEVVPVRPLDEEADGATQREVLTKQAGELDMGALQGDTALHESLWAAYEHMQTTASDNAAGGVVMLTDGINDQPGGGMTEKQLVEKLEKARSSDDKPVSVVLIGIGPDVDFDALKRIADAAGGESIVLRDPTELPQVFVDAVATRSG